MEPRLTLEQVLGPPTETVTQDVTLSDPNGDVIDVTLSDLQKGDISEQKGDISSLNGDIWMSPQRLTNVLTTGETSSPPLFEAPPPTANGRQTKKPKSPRENAPLFDSVLAACRWDTKTLTVGERARVGRAVKELRAVGATPDEIIHRGTEARRRWGSRAFGPQALVNNWQSLAETPAIDYDQPVEFYR